MTGIARDAYTERALTLSLVPGSRGKIVQRRRIEPNVSIKYFLMIFYYTHRLMPSLPVIREASPSN